MQGTVQLWVAERVSLDETVAHMEGLYGEVAVTTDLRTRFECTKFAVALCEQAN